jgi:hypothetical protein
MYTAIERPYQQTVSELKWNVNEMHPKNGKVCIFLDISLRGELKITCIFFHLLYING